MGVSCCLLLRPFLNLIITGVILAVAISPGYQMLTDAFRGRAKLAAAFCTVLLLAVIILPAVLLAGTLVDGIRNIARQLQAGQLNIPAPPPSLDRLPVVG